MENEIKFTDRNAFPGLTVIIYHKIHCYSNISFPDDFQVIKSTRNFKRSIIDVGVSKYSHVYLSVCLDRWPQSGFIT